jgi:ribose/xylose/arabinose/galactoside ABC-type transport system permease subunit
MSKESEMQSRVVDSPTRRRRAWAGIKSNLPLIGMILVILAGGAAVPTFFLFANLRSVAEQSTILILVSMGLSIPMLMRGVDLSSAQIVDATALMAAALVAHGYPIIVAILAPIAMGALIGAVNGALMGYVGVPAIIGTLGMMFLVRSGEMIYSKGTEPQILFTLPDSITGPFFFLAQGKVGPIPMVLVICAAVVVAMRFLTKSTIIGRRQDAVGGNVKAAFFSGVNVKRVFAGGFVISGILASLSGIMLASWTGIAAPRGAEAYLLESFVAVYLGTVITKRGQISIIGTLIGALFVGALNNLLTLLGMGAAAQGILNGAFVLLAMAVGAFKSKRS